MTEPRDPALVRVERGVADEEELAALTALLLARAAAAHTPAPHPHLRTTAHWTRHRPYHSPHSWQAPA
ncbi:acyl-CoA carboxylase epsilon subunit [Streptomyces sp. GXMU-J15]|uniref:Acyl-CoA carboxylase epsilon subunit n=1 Tax=Streptomyces fuscus TaxID=3048495 RepID=A0ABT7JEG7_9ACTN|nr:MULTISPECIES: acyl-CoA carboxylase epsilon subunit [Streptomyces]MDL2081913.1 acyl-CoA carboxylase epsilon subunit [Streptomyces fuscus]SBT95686.1 Acyl-CoA carboxylase epsilon subunit [Streptomyces sp. DI166]